MRNDRNTKRTSLFVISIFVCFFLPWYTHANELPAGEGGVTITAIVTSDLHYTTNPFASSAVTAGIAFADEIAGAIVEQVIAEHPDVFIMTGDNTNTGSLEDAAALVKKLERIKDAGILVVVTTGNHDFNHCSSAQYEKTYFPVFDIADRDANSLSYMTCIGDTLALFAMDDNSATMGEYGCFSTATQQWLQEMLVKYGDREILVLSHHNILAGKGQENSETYHIQNEGLAECLEENGVHLVLTGHLHAQMLMEENGMYELISAMPYAAPHTFGRMRITEEEISYESVPIDISGFGSETLAEKLERLDEENETRIFASFQSTIEEYTQDHDRTEAALDLTKQFFRWYTQGNLVNHVIQIKQSAGYEDMINALWESNYGPWMQAMLEQPMLNAQKWTISLCS